MREFKTTGAVGASKKLLGQCVMFRDDGWGRKEFFSENSKVLKMGAVDADESSVGNAVRQISS